jgi:hypothetical protein
VEASQGDADVAKGVFGRAVAADELNFLPELLNLGETLPHGPETIRVARAAVIQAGGAAARLDRILRERTEPREFPEEARKLLTELVERVAPDINGLIEAFAAKGRTAPPDGGAAGP